MSTNWIDTKTYFGWCRREARDRFRLLDRRRADASIEPPSLASLIRRMRVMTLTLATPEARIAFLERLNVTIDLAHSQGATECGRQLNELAELMVDAGAQAEKLGAEADRRLAAASSTI